jgi:hypothetical protein
MLVAVSAVAQAPAGKKPHGPTGILVLDGSPIHDAGNLRSHASNWGAIGSMPGASYPFSPAPSAEWPAGSRVEYLFIAGVWVGGMIGGVPSVSTAAYEFEFRPSPDVRDIVYETAFGAAAGHRIPSSLADDDSDGLLDEDILDGYDNDGDGSIDEDFAAISDQMLSRIFTDDVTGIYPQHRPLQLSVREESYQFSHPDYDDFVGFTFWFTNHGNETIENVYVGVFADGDVGHRDRPDYWEDDATGYQGDIAVDHGPHGVNAYDFAYWYDVDGDAGQAPGYAGIVILDHPTDPSGIAAPPQVGAVTYAHFSGSAAYEDGGDPTNDFERYELMSSGSIERPATAPGDYRSLVAVGPFASIAPGETMTFRFALVVTPRDDFTHVQRAAEAYHGQWFDLDGDPFTGIDGREHQEHWYLPGAPVPVAITRFGARSEGREVRLEWEMWANEVVAAFEILRAEGSGGLLPLVSIDGSRRAFVDRTAQPGARYEYQLVAHGADGGIAVSQRVSALVPRAALALHPNSPNPFASMTTVAFTLPARADVELSVFDVAGRHVATLFAGEKGAGDYEIEWNGTDDDGRPVGAGVYFCRMRAGKELLTRKLLVMR